ncbi:undecaprenyl-phosphate alpha-N-acetylglucosaminyl 1-phosphate transferase [Alkalibacterium kapii]|uniref:Undecaprenyl-phosphate alpha-N-acetylglucosaminyl 1-phosphate transferase n=2 Tax=Alkalibacterium kapii TaxID=426704 RepID=A0A511AS82_9LACT|nr:undecaprenyl-phosphate alpha-N-acetylglucosaminyl 1-phosphate transferase [Alkalibacterium kapii]
MYDMYQVIVNVLLTALISVMLTPLVRKLSFKVGAVDVPNKRRVNKETMPSMGGLAIYLTFFFSLFVLQPVQLSISVPIFLGATIVLLTGIVDDIKEISPKAKMLGLIIAAVVIVLMNDLTVVQVSVPFMEDIFLPTWIGFPLTIFWILAITNSINLIDGLDGLASGVSIIALTTMGIIGVFFLESASFVTSIIIFTLVGAIIGFLPYNFFPARIYLGDTGALFLGFMISVMSLYGLKNVTLITLIIPIVILGIPITDTVYAMLRRKLNKMPMSSADRHHMHHRLMSLGLTHKQTVLVIYLIAGIFSMIALLYPLSSLYGSILITIALLIGLEIFIELIGLVGEDRRPLLKKLSRFVDKLNNKDNK